MKPYVVSADIRLLLQEWADQHGFVLPPEEFFRQLRREFQTYARQIFRDFDFVPEEELLTGVERLVAGSGLPVISLDRAYYRSWPALEICRLVDKEGNRRGLGSRPGSLPLSEQFRQLQEAGFREVALFDDVVWTGALVAWICQKLEQISIRVPLVCAGIEIEKVETPKGFRGSQWLKEVAGVEIRSVRSYREVADQICERDFYPGVPLSGRQLVGGKNIGVPYLLPFGRPGDWASIPKEWELPFSRFCIKQTIKLFEEIEHYSSRIVCCQDLERGVVSLPGDSTRFVDALRLQK